MYSGVGSLGSGIASNLWRGPSAYRLGNSPTIMFIRIGLLTTAIIWGCLNVVNAHRLKYIGDLAIINSVMRSYLISYTL